MYEALKNPGTNCLFVGLTRASAKAIIWKDVLRVIDRMHGLKARFNLTELTMTLSNGSVIRLAGIDSDESDMLKLLGAKYRLVCIDEASLYSVDVRNLVYGILKPAMTDPNASGQRGTICLTGTSSNFTRGLFYDVTTGRETCWALHTWSALDNPHVARQWQEELDEIALKRPLYMETPQFKQWYLNQWVVDEDKLVYRYGEDRNVFTELPRLAPEGWSFVLGVDLGYEDDTAFTLSAYHVNDPNLYILRTFKRKHMLFEDKPGKVSVISKIEEFMRHPTQAPQRIIVDGAVKKAVETMRVRSSIPFEYADKTGKADYIELMNADLIQGKIKLHKDCTELRDECMSLVWMTDGDKIRLPKKENPSLSNHLADSALYNWRCGYHYASQPATKKTVKGSKEWYEEQAQGIWERERERLEQEAQGGGDWPSGGDWGSA